MVGQHSAELQGLPIGAHLARSLQIRAVFWNPQSGPFTSPLLFEPLCTFVWALWNIYPAHRDKVTSPRSLNPDVIIFFFDVLDKLFSHSSLIYEMEASGALGAMSGIFCKNIFYDLAVSPDLEMKGAQRRVGRKE